MATQEQVKEALQRLQAQEARIAELETQLQIERKERGAFRLWERCGKIVAVSIQKGLDNPSL